MSVTIAFQTDKPLASYSAIAAQAEAYGFDAVTVYNDMLYQPAWLPLLEMARATKRVRLGVAAVNPFTCHPINIAGNIALLDEASNGRMYLGLARGAWLDYIGLNAKNAPAALREAFECVRHLLSHSTAPYEGKYFPLAGGDTLRWQIARADIPFLLGAWGPATIRACLPFVSEIKLGGTANPEMVRRMRAFLDEECRTIGRDPASVGIVAGAVSVVAPDGAAARARAKREVALYLPVIADLDPTLDLDPRQLQTIREYAAQYDFVGAAGQIDDKLLKKIAFAGTPDDLAEHAAELVRAGASRIEFGTPHGLTMDEGLKLLGARVLPALKSGGGNE